MHSFISRICLEPGKVSKQNIATKVRVYSFWGSDNWRVAYYYTAYTSGGGVTGVGRSVTYDSIGPVDDKDFDFDLSIQTHWQYPR